MKFWQKKFDDNVPRDAVVKAELLERGTKCLIILECTIKRMVKSRYREVNVIEKCNEFLVSPTLFKEL